MLCVLRILMGMTPTKPPNQSGLSLAPDAPGGTRHQWFPVGDAPKLLRQRWINAVALKPALQRQTPGSDQLESFHSTSRSRGRTRPLPNNPSDTLNDTVHFPVLGRRRPVTLGWSGPSGSPRVFGICQRPTDASGLQKSIPGCIENIIENP
jgi:hypothetical protein